MSSKLPDKPDFRPEIMAIINQGLDKRAMRIALWALVKELNLSGKACQELAYEMMSALNQAKK